MAIHHIVGKTNLSTISDEQALRLQFYESLFKEHNHVVCNFYYFHSLMSKQRDSDIYPTQHGYH